MEPDASERGTGHPPAPELTVVVPTFNERDNVPLVVERLSMVLAGIAWEVVFVDDDSPDGTAEAAAELARHDSRVRVIRRIGRRGLSSACVEGVLSSTAPWFAVMDGDLQHDDAALPRMFSRIKAEDLDIVVGSRYVEGLPVESLSGHRARVSNLGTRVSRLVLRAGLTDPMSGFFVMRRETFDQEVRSLSLQGFKILLDIFTSSPRPLRFAEEPCRFHVRRHGESKLDTMIAWEFGLLILDKLVGGLVPVRFVLFGLVGTLGLAAHLAALSLLNAAGLDFTYAQIAALILAMTFNFFLNNLITYRDQRLRGGQLLRGLVSFYAICSLGAIANIGVAEMVYSRRGAWWLAGFAGAVIGVVWNFAASSYLTWRRRRGG